MGEAHRNCSSAPRGGWPFMPEMSKEQAADRLRFIQQRHDEKVARLAERGIIVGNRALSNFLE